MAFNAFVLDHDPQPARRLEQNLLQGLAQFSPRRLRALRPGSRTQPGVDSEFDGVEFLETPLLSKIALLGPRLALRGRRAADVAELFGGQHLLPAICPDFDVAYTEQISLDSPKGFRAETRWYQGKRRDPR